jgi:hypothetical protein
LERVWGFRFVLGSATICTSCGHSRSCDSEVGARAVKGGQSRLFTFHSLNDPELLSVNTIRGTFAKHLPLFHAQLYAIIFEPLVHLACLVVLGRFFCRTAILRTALLYMEVLILYVNAAAYLI